MIAPTSAIRVPASGSCILLERYSVTEKMIPYLHLGPLTIPTFGLMVAIALIVSAYILQADFDRRGFKADAFAMITIAGLLGIAGAKLYHLLESPAEFFANPIGLFFTRYGFAWFGGFIGGFGKPRISRLARAITHTRISGCMLAGSRVWLRHRAHRLFFIWRWRLWQAHFASMGHELSKWCRSDN